MKNKIEDLRNHLFTTLESLSEEDPAKRMDLDRAKAISQVAHEIIESAKVEVAFINATGNRKGTGFIPLPEAVPEPGSRPQLAAGGGRGTHW